MASLIGIDLAPWTVNGYRVAQRWGRPPCAGADDGASQPRYEVSFMNQDAVARLRSVSDASTQTFDQAYELAILKEAKVLAGRRRARRYVIAAAVVLDILAVVVAMLFGSQVRFGNAFHELGLNLVSIVLPIYLAIAGNAHAFGIDAVARARLGARRSVTALFLALAAVGLVVFFLKAGTEYSRAIFGVGAAVAAFALPFGRFLLAIVTRRVLGQNTLCEVVICDGVISGDTGDALVFDAQALGLSARLDDPDMFDRLGRLVVHADRVIVLCPPERRGLWSFTLKGADVNAEVIAPDLDELGALGIGCFEGGSTLIVASAPLAGLDRTLKRALDVTLTLLVLPVAIPVMLAVAIAIRLDSPGPVLFVQRRVGLGNRIFNMYKFRSMYVHKADKMGAESVARSGDNRVTRVGRFIRSTSLDELPQLLNVLGGAMSIVGPRPHPILCRAEDRLLWDIDLRYWHRHAIKPGLTGLAQVRGLRGATEKESHFTDRLQADLEYLSGWTIWRDILIILATFRVIVHRNAF
jgi:polysaccharide biosynthesis protein PslA